MKRIFAKLTRADLRIPLPGDTRIFPAAGMVIDAETPFWAALIAEGSIAETDRPKPEQAAGKGRPQKG